MTWNASRIDNDGWIYVCIINLFCKSSHKLASDADDNVCKCVLFGFFFVSFGPKWWQCIQKQTKQKNAHKYHFYKCRTVAVKSCHFNSFFSLIAYLHKQKIHLIKQKKVFISKEKNKNGFLRTRFNIWGPKTCPLLCMSK